MTPVRSITQRLRYAAALVAISSSTAFAQQSLPMPPAEVDAVPEIALPMESSVMQGESAHEMVYPQEMIAPGGGYFMEPGGEYCNDCNECQQYDLWDAMPAVTESSGTWLDRGFWYAETDVVVFERIWNRDDLLMAFHSQTGGSALFMKGDGNADAAVRTTLGRFLFRDEDNRNHSAEFSIYAGGDWTHDCSAAGIGNGTLVVPTFLSQNNNQQTFNGASGMQVVYTSRFNNFEANYRVKSRMGKDQMHLMPTGEWIRKAQPSWTKEYLIGLRYIDFTERFRWDAQGLPQATGLEDGQYFIRTDNNMLGIQLGSGHAYETARWAIEGLGKIGALLNDAKGRQRFTIDDNDGLGFLTNASDEVLNFVMEARLTGRYHLRPNVSLRLGLETFYLSNVAIAPHQITFAPVNSKLATTGDSFYMGISAGIEGYW